MDTVDSLNLEVVGSNRTSGVFFCSPGTSIFLFVPCHVMSCLTGQGKCRDMSSTPVSSQIRQMSQIMSRQLRSRQIAASTGTAPECDEFAVGDELVSSSSKASALQLSKFSHAAAMISSNRTKPARPERHLRSKSSVGASVLADMRLLVSAWRPPLAAGARRAVRPLVGVRSRKR